MTLYVHTSNPIRKTYVLRLLQLRGTSMTGLPQPLGTSPSQTPAPPPKQIWGAPVGDAVPERDT